MKYTKKNLNDSETRQNLILIRFLTFYSPTFILFILCYSDRDTKSYKISIYTSLGTLVFLLPNLKIIQLCNLSIFIILQGSYYCGFCGEGYAGIPSISCYSTNFCQTGQHTCSQYATCIYLGPDNKFLSPIITGQREWPSSYDW